MRRPALLGALAVIVAAMCCSSSPATPTVPTADVDAHDGKIIEAEGAYWWYGTAYNCGFSLNTPGTRWCGMRAYRSDDLVRWEDRGFAIEPTEEWQRRCTPPLPLSCFRPHVVRSPETGRYLLWVNTYDTLAGYRVLEAKSPEGPWTELPLPTLATGAMRGDHDVVVGPDGRGWIAYTVFNPMDGNHHDIAIERLTPALTSGTGEYVRLGQEMVEAPGLFSRGDRWFLTFSDPACPYCGGTGTGLATAPSPLGPWTITGRLSENSCGGQPAAVSKLGDRYLYQSDLWEHGKPNQANAAYHHEWLRFEAETPAPLTCRQDVRRSSG
jgi:hypothetical protein